MIVGVLNEKQIVMYDYNAKCIVCAQLLKINDGIRYW